MPFWRPSLPGGAIGGPLAFPLSALAQQRGEQRQLRVEHMYNNSGAEVPIGSIVKLDTSVTAYLAFTTSTLEDDTGSFGVTLETMPTGRSGQVAFSGKVEMRTASGTGIHQFCRQSAAAGVASGTSSPTKGTFARTTSIRNTDTGRQEALLMQAPMTAQIRWELGFSTLGESTILN